MNGLPPQSPQVGYLFLAAFVLLTTAGLGGWIASQKRRAISEGVALGLIFGPLGALVEALLPMGSQSSSAGSPHAARSIDDEGRVAYVADRFREALEEADANWRALPPRRRRSLTRSVEEGLRKELKLSPTAFSEIAAEARRSLES